MYTRLAGVVCCLAAAVTLVVSADAVASDRQAEYIQLRLLIGEQRFSEALDRCRILIAKYPDYVYLYETMAEIALYAQDLNGAAKFFEERIEDGTGLELSYFGLGTVYYNMAAYREAALCFDRAIELGIAAPECYRNFVYAYERLEGVDASIRFFNSLCHRNPQNPHLWYAVALAYWSKRDYPVVLKSIDAALARNSHEEKYLQAKAAVLLLTGKKKEGADLTSESIDHANRACDLAGIQFLSSYDVLRQDGEGVPNSDNELADQSLETAKRFGQFRWIGWWYERLATLEYWKSQFQSAIKHSQIAFEASVKCSDNQLAIDALIRQVESSIDLGLYDSAIEYAYKELEISKEAKDNSKIARSMSDLAWIYHELGIEDIAMDYAIEAFALCENIKATNELLMKIHVTLGLIYEAVGNYQSALANLTAADQLLPKGGDWVPTRAVSQGNIGRVFMKLGELDKAINHISQEYSLSRACKFLREEVYSLVSRADINVCLNRPSIARRLYLQAYKLSINLGQRPTLLSSAIGLARLAVKSGKLHESITWYDTAFAAAESMGLIWEGQLLREIYRNPYERDMKDYVNSLVLLGQNQEAFNFAEKCKFSSSIGSLHLFRTPQSLVEFPDSARQLLYLASRQLSEFSYSLKLPRESGLTKGSRYDLGLLEKTVLAEIKIRRSVNGLRKAMPKTINSFWPKAATLHDVQRVLRNHSTAAIEYLVGEESCLAFLATTDTMHVVSLQIGREELERLIDRISNVFPSKGGHSWSASFANFEVKACAESYRKLLEPVLQKVPAVDELIIIPDGILAGIPFECFVTEDELGGGFSKVAFVVNKLTLSYSTTATSLTLQNEPAHHVRSALLAVGNPETTWPVSELWGLDTLSPALLKSIHGLPPLPGAEKEVFAIQREFQGNATILLGTEATKTKLKSLISDFKVIHIASHTKIDEDCPMRSTIYLAAEGEGMRSSVLCASEFAGSGINAGLVVLSSCNTVRFSKGVDEAGFIQALSRAGVPSVVASLWSADDNSTAFLMARFYHHLWAGEGIAKALQKAKVDLILSGKTDPYFWAPFILVGDRSALELSPDSWEWTESWSFGGILAALVLFSIGVYQFGPQSREGLQRMLARRRR